MKSPRSAAEFEQDFDKHGDLKFRDDFTHIFDVASKSVLNARPILFDSFNEQRFLLYRSSVLSLHHARDHLWGAADLLPPQASSMAPYTLLRTSLESTTRAYWLLDQSVDAKERDARVLDVSLSNLDRVLGSRACRNDVQLVNSAQAAKVALNEHARANGVRRRRMGQISKITKRLVPYDPDLYDELSALVHGTMAYVLGTFRRTSGSRRREMIGQHEIAFMIVRVTNAFVRTVALYARHFGHAPNPLISVAYGVASKYDIDVLVYEIDEA